MYCYFPNKRFWEEKVAWVTWINWTEGDFSLIDGEYALLLWEYITAHELIQGQATAVRYEVVHKELFSLATLRLLHSFVGMRYTSYTNSVPLRIWSDIPALLKRRWKPWKRIERSWTIDISAGAFVFSACEKPVSTQQLIVFPDIWTMHQQLPARLFDQPWVVRWHSWLSVLQKAAIYRWCKQGSIHTLLTTPAGIFQDRVALQSILLVDAHKRWYKSVQDPRYRTPTVVKDMQEVFSCSLKASGVLLV